MKTALITGTSSGIGLASAVRLARAGYAVVATMRDPTRAGALLEAAQAAGVTLEVVRLDVTDDHSVRSAVEGVIARHGRIDAVINNAGAGNLGSTEQVSVERLHRIMDLNLYGVWRVTQAVLPHMRLRASGRIVSVSSVGGLMGQPFNDAYCAAKFALEGMMECLAPVAAKLGIQVTLVEPGPVNTRFVANVGGQELLGNPDDPYLPLMGAYANAIRGAFASAGQTPDEVAEVILEAVSAEAPHFRYQTSEGVRARVAAKLTDPTGDALVAAMARMLES